MWRILLDWPSACYTALTETRDAYYERNRFAEVFTEARRVPDRMLPEIMENPRRDRGRGAGGRAWQV